jgi:hypothetical protein
MNQTEPGPRIPDVPHGTLAGWLQGCRCLCCMAAKRANPDVKDPAEK